ncbi:hypothetical protein M378DRAFT_166372 [Amanita muscaria Koide BX008]|uniref:Uncharacterized protein n=1 Tax=Amanita muscaria (strain Koide BX008) TaxID=946122 RepID=A0A0C2WYG6_AMAMK|nr:hypothetical protein M378DRAFT_166372 [Amanita muscaria Koide BX008]
MPFGKASGTRATLASRRTGLFVSDTRTRRNSLMHRSKALSREHPIMASADI